MCARRRPGLRAKLIVGSSTVPNVGWAIWRFDPYTHLVQFVRIEVENACAPIDDPLIEELFAPYAQGRERQPGVGLGLHIVREIARAHEGTAYGHCSDGRIAFTIELPVRA